jgi:hypothetical protein
MSVRPTVLIGLGDAGGQAAAHLNGLLRGDEPDLAPLLQVLAITSEHGERIGAEGLSCLSLPDLDTAITPGVWKRNHDTLAAHEREIADLVTEAIQASRPLLAVRDLTRRGIEVDREPGIFLVATTFDPVGSAALLPVLGFINARLHRLLADLAPQINVLLLGPDLFYRAESCPEEVYARTAALFRELQAAADDAERTLGGDSLFGSFVCWLVQGQNENGNEVGGLSELLPMVSQAVAALQTNRVSGSVMVGAVQTPAGARPFSSFGSCQIVSGCDQAAEAVSWGVLAAIWDRGEGEVARDETSALVETFLRRVRLTEPCSLLDCDAEGRPIVTPFRYDGSVGPETDAADYVARLESQIDAFHRGPRLAIQRALSQRAGELLTQLSREIREEASHLIDADDHGLERAHGFLRVLVQEESEFLAGEVSDYHLTLVSSASDVRGFFDEKLGLTADRTEAQRLQSDLKTKERMLDRLQDDLARTIAQSQHAVAATLSPPAPLDPFRDAVELDDLKAEIQELVVQIAKTRKQQNEIELRLRPHDSAMNDAGQRRRRAEELASKMGAEADNIKREQLPVLESEQQAALRVVEQLQAGLRKLRRFLVYCGSFVAALVVATALLFALPVSLHALKQALIIITAVLLVAYLTVAGDYYLSRSRSLRSARNQARHYGERKKEQMLRMQLLARDMIALRFDFARHGLLLALIDGLQSESTELAQRLLGFRSTGLGLAPAWAENWRTFEFEGSTFKLVAFTRSFLEIMLTRQRAGVEALAREFLRVSPLSVQFSRYCAEGSAAAVAFGAADYVEQRLHLERDFGVDQVLMGRLAAGDLISGRIISQLTENSRSFVKLAGANTNDGSVSLYSIATAAANERASFFREELDKNEIVGAIYRPQFYATPNPHEARVFHFRLGIPPERLVLATYGEQQLGRATDRRDYYAVPGLHSFPLFPVVNDDVRRQAALACALGLADMVDGYLIFHGGRFFDRDDLCSKAREYGGTQLRERLKTSVAESLGHRVAAARRLRDALATLALDRFEQRAVQDKLDELEV